MKQKVTIIKTCLVGLLSGLMLGACSDFLSISPLDKISMEDFWNEKADVDNVVAGCYSNMQSQAVVERMMAWGEFRSDNLVGGTNVEGNVNLMNIFKENINGSNTYVKWGDFYNVINRCNLVLYYAPRVAENDPNYTHGDLLATQAEVTAIRALMYFYLIRTFRDVPYITQPFLDDNQKMDIPASAFDEVLDCLIQDLENVQTFAVKKYPVTKTYYQRGRITQDAIHAMLADMYLWKQDYANAVRYADIVIEAKKAEYQEDMSKKVGTLSENEQLIDGYPLIGDKMTTGNYYGNAYQYIFGDGNSRESIFELIFMDDEQMLANGAVGSYYGNGDTEVGVVRPADFISTDVTDEVFEVFLNKYDARYYENHHFGESNKPNGVRKYASPTASVDLTKAEIMSYNSVYYPNGLCHANWIIYRLTDVMLMKAEAMVEMANESDTTEYGKLHTDSLLQAAFAIVNTVNKRSNCSSEKELDKSQYATQSLIRNLVMDERQRELMYEGKRWFDLVRRSRREGNSSYLVGRVTRKGSSGGTSNADFLSHMDAIYWPYHNDELKVNGNLVQNPIFGSGENESYEQTK